MAARKQILEELDSNFQSQVVADRGMQELGGEEIYTEEEWAEDENAYRKGALSRHISIGVDLQALLEDRVRVVVDKVSVVAQLSLDTWSALGQLNWGGDTREEKEVLLSRNGAKERLERSVQCKAGVLDLVYEDGHGH